jgi:hypothetical protein
VSEICGNFTLLMLFVAPPLRRLRSQRVPLYQVRNWRLDIVERTHHPTKTKGIHSRACSHGRTRYSAGVAAYSAGDETASNVMGPQRLSLTSLASRSSGPKEIRSAGVVAAMRTTPMLWSPSAEIERR